MKTVEEIKEYIKWKKEEWRVEMELMQGLGEYTAMSKCEKTIEMLDDILAYIEGDEK